nr:hypothetical protein [Tanacetum cinerariifolium]GEX48051.1 hypothetical protein [Tanacetum cinerariifolium]
MKRNLKEVFDENTTMEEMGGKVSASLENIRNYRQHLTTESDEIIDIEEGVSELEHMSKISSSEHTARTCHAHSTLSEVVKKAVMVRSKAANETGKEGKSNDVIYNNERFLEKAAQKIEIHDKLPQRKITDSKRNFFPDASPIALSTGYIADEEDPADYLADGGNDDDESSDHDDDDDDDDDDDLLIMSPPPRRQSRLRPMSLPLHHHRHLHTVLLLGCLADPSKEKVAKLLALPTPPPSPLTPLSSPLP